MNQREAIRQELHGICAQFGSIVPSVVVDRAEDEDNPMHSRFEWDDTVAGRAYRIRQAHDLIREFTIRHWVDRAGETTENVVREFVPLRACGVEDAPPGYLPIETVEANPAAREALLRQMRRETQIAHRKYQHLEEYWKLLDELKQPVT